MSAYFDNRLFKIGLWLLVLGSGPLLAIILLAAIGLWPDTISLNGRARDRGA